MHHALTLVEGHKMGSNPSKAKEVKLSDRDANNRALLEAIDNSDFDAIYKIADNGNIDLNVANEYGQAAFVLAFHNRNYQLMELIINKGVDVNKAGVDGGTALYGALINDNFELAEFLVKHGADVNFIFPYEKRSLLATLCRRGDSYESVRFLVSHGADLNLVDAEGYTALNYCLDRPKFAALLLAAGAEIEVLTAIRVQELFALSHGEFLKEFEGIKENNDAIIGYFLKDRVKTTHKEQLEQELNNYLYAAGGDSVARIIGRAEKAPVSIYDAFQYVIPYLAPKDFASVQQVAKLDEDEKPLEKDRDFSINIAKEYAKEYAPKSFAARLDLAVRESSLGK
ncbi:MAG: ankyrin repeat protein [Rickettsiaceae bacterium]|jgi:hypothetical protein|nr:ankyrin repeat protein [Rickettsiaceae bacterium]